MAGVDVGGGGGKGKRALDSEINMIPFIDLLMVTIAFLLITAVWSHMARINADAQVPGPPRPDVEQQDIPPEKVLHLEMRSPEKFTIVWKAGSQVVTSIDVPRKDDLKDNNGVKSIRYGAVTCKPDDQACFNAMCGRPPESRSLAETVACEWSTSGSHRAPGDKKLDQAVLHTDNDTQYVYIIGVIDAIYQTHRKAETGGKVSEVPAFNVTFAVN
jgi:biopolymer transport protein ExbD